MRTLRRHPDFAAVAVVSLAVGIGFNTAVFSVINAVFFTSLSGVRDPSGLVCLDGRHSSAGFRYLRETATSLSGVAAWLPVAVQIR